MTATASDTGRRQTRGPAIALEGVGKIYPLRAPVGERLRGALFGRRATPAYHRALSDVTLSIAPGETVGLLGVNGAGKSTLLQIITGVLTPSEGQVSVDGRIAALLELGAGFNPALTGRQNAEFQCRLNGATAAEIPQRLAEIEEFADVGYYFDQPMRTYSSGMYVRVAFAAAIAVDPDILVIDEALAVGDARFQNKCYRRLEEFKAAGKTILLVTHSADLVTRQCSRGVVLDKGRIELDGAAGDAAARYLEILYGAPAQPKSAPAQEPAQEERRDDGAGPQKEEGAGFLRALMTPSDRDRLPERVGYNPSERRSGTGRAAIVDAALLLNDSPATPWIDGGARMAVAMQVRCGADIENPVYTVQLKSVDDVLIWSYSTYWAAKTGLAPVPQPARRGAHVATIVDFDAALAAGEYFIDLAVGEDRDGVIEILDWRMSALHIFIKRPLDFLGFADLKGRHRMTVLDEGGSKESAPRLEAVEK